MAKNKKNKSQEVVESIENTEVATENLELSAELSELGVETEQALFLTEETAEEGFLPEATEEVEELLGADDGESVEGTELESFEAAQIEDLEFVEDEQIESIVESILFASDRPVSFMSIQQVFKGTTVKKDKIRRKFRSSQLVLYKQNFLSA